MACQLHDGRLQRAGTRLLQYLSAHGNFSYGTHKRCLIVTYRLDEGAICARTIHYSYSRASREVRVRLCALNQLTGAECFVRRSLFLGHGGGCVLMGFICGRVSWCSSWLELLSWSRFLRKLSCKADLRQAISTPPPEPTLRMLPDANNTSPK